MYLNSDFMKEPELKSNLTLTRVVFELSCGITSMIFLINLTLTRVVFELSCGITSMIFLINLTLTRVVFEYGDVFL